MTARKMCCGRANASINRNRLIFQGLSIKAVENPLGYATQAYQATMTGECHIETRNSDPRPGPNQLPQKQADETRINEQIRVPRVRLIDEEGEMQGVMPMRTALEKAQALGLDLVEISPNADPPVCKILDYGKYRYQEQKRKAEARKKQKIVEIKELKLRPGIEEHDLDVKMKAAIRFLEAGDKVKFTLRFRGREMSHQHLGFKLMQRVKEILEGKIRVDQEPRLEGNQAIMLVSPPQK